MKIINLSVLGCASLSQWLLISSLYEMFETLLSTHDSGICTGVRSESSEGSLHRLYILTNVYETRWEIPPKIRMTVTTQDDILFLGAGILNLT